MACADLEWRLLLRLCLAAFAMLPTTLSQATNATAPVSTFQSRPDLQAPFLNITLHADEQVTPGYIFLAPYQSAQPGPYIYDNAGNLVWSGFGPTGQGPTHEFHVCTYKRKDHLCYFNGQQYTGFARGHGLIMDNTLNVVASVTSQAGLMANDLHEFKMVDGGKSAIITIYETQQYDMSEYGITEGMGWILNCYFQEIEIGTDKVLFEWSALDHVHPSYSYVLPNSTEVAGTGLDASASWDYFHINSVDKNNAGDYLVSARHTSTIYKVSGKTGEIKWQVGGMSSPYTMADGLNFSSQHDCRFLQENDTTTVISLFDNASNGYNQTSSYSSGMIIAIDHTTNHAILFQRYIAPEGMISASQGNAQVLRNNNVFVGWGSNAYISEYTADGTPVLVGHFATTGSMHYRAYKFNFTTHPTTAPAAYVYAQNNSAPTTYYMSWNGATEVSQWRIHTSTSSNGPWTELMTVRKAGFETIFTAPQYQEWSIIEALNSKGEGLANSSRPVGAFVPSSSLASACDDVQCALADSYSHQPSTVPVHPGGPTVIDADPSTPTTHAGRASSNWSLSSVGCRLTWLLLVVISMIMP